MSTLNWQTEIREKYIDLRSKILLEFESRGHMPVYKNFPIPNLVGTEIPIGFENEEMGVRFKYTPLFYILQNGKIEELKELLNNPEELEQYIETFFPENSSEIEDATEKEIDLAA